MPNEWDDYRPATDISTEHAASLNPAEVAAKTVGKAVKTTLWDAPISLGTALGRTVEDPFKGRAPGASLWSATAQGMNDSHTRAMLAEAAGNHGEAAFHHVMSVLPVIGALGDDTVQNIKQGWQTNDPDKLSTGLSNVLSIVAPELARAIPGSRLGKIGANAATSSAASNFEKIFQPLPSGEAGASLVPSVQRTAQRLAESPETIRGGPTQVGEQLDAARQKYGPAAGTARNGQSLLNPEPLIKAVQKSMDKDVYVQESGTPQIKNPVAKQLYDELLGRIEAARQPATVAPGLLAPGQAAPAAKSLVSEKALDDLKDMFNARAKGKDIVMKQNPTVGVGDEAKWERVMANHIADSLGGVNNVADAAEANYALFATAKRLYQASQNRAYISKAESGIGLPLSMGAGGQFRMNMPNSIKTMIDGVRWNTVSASAKKAVASSLAKGDWNSAVTKLQLTKLGVPIAQRDSNDTGDNTLDWQTR